MSETPPRTVVILGATSAVAVAYARLIADPGLRIVLVGRDEEALNMYHSDLIARGADTSSKVIVGALGNPDKVDDLMSEALSEVDEVSEVLLAYGALGADMDTKDLGAVRDLFDVNLTSAALWCEGFANVFEQQGSGSLLLIGSVAGDRGRQSNYLYGATKSGLERLAEGLGHRFARNKAINIVLIKPGFIKTPMTEHIPNRSGPLWSSPEKIARIIDKAKRKKRLRVYAPWYWRFILLIIRALPVGILHRTKL